MGKKIYLTIIWVAAILAIIFGVGVRFCGWFNKQNTKDSDKSVKSGLEATKTVDAFDTIDIETGIADLDFEFSDDDTYSVYYKATKKRLVPIITCESGKLKICGEEDYNASLKDANNLNLEIVITVPKDAALKNVTVQAGAGDVDVKDITIDNLVLELGAGDLDIKNVKANKMDIEAGAGDVDVSGLGDLREYSFDISVGLGDLKVGGQAQSGVVGDYETDGTTDKKIEIDCGMGDVDISE